MRKIVFAILAAAFALPAHAETRNAAAAAPGSYAGTWGFQTEDYGNDQYGVAMSGVAVITPAQAANRYNIRLLAQELITQRESGLTHLLIARENCTGDGSNGQLAITCEMAEPVQNYQPDSFILQPGENADQLVGALSSASNGSATFNRMR
ncbi:MAG: hypothetical protein JSS00_03300 [Proteobacteria bacterium]|nr:hypothetical protein [Pseudomonadota bacterium]